MFRSLLALTLAPLLAGAAEDPPTPEQYCRGLKTTSEAQCKDTAKADSRAGAQLDKDCPHLVPQLLELERRKTDAIAKCSKAGKTQTRKAARKTRGTQEAAPTDTAGMMGATGDSMRKCGEQMEAIRKEFEQRGALVDQQRQNLGAESVQYANANCRTHVLRNYDVFKERIAKSIADLEAKKQEYETAAQALVDPAGRNKKNGDRMDSANPKDANKQEQPAGGGGGGGGMPQLPQFPNKQPEKDKTKELQDALKKQKDDACKAALDAYRARYSLCEAFNCQPALGRVESVCKSYNDCVDALPAVPADCPGAPKPLPHK